MFLDWYCMVLSISSNIFQTCPSFHSGSGTCQQLNLTFSNGLSMVRPSLARPHNWSDNFSLLSPCLSIAPFCTWGCTWLPSNRSHSTNMYESYRILLEWSPENHSACSTRAMRSLFWPVWHGHGSSWLSNLWCSFHPTNIQHEKGKARQNRNNFVRNQHCSRIFKTRSFHTYPKIPLFIW